MNRSRRAITPCTSAVDDVHIRLERHVHLHGNYAARSPNHCPRCGRGLTKYYYAGSKHWRHYPGTSCR